MVDLERIWLLLSAALNGEGYIAYIGNLCIEAALFPKMTFEEIRYCEHNKLIVYDVSKSLTGKQGVVYKALKLPSLPKKKPVSVKPQVQKKVESLKSLFGG